MTDLELNSLFKQHKELLIRYELYEFRKFFDKSGEYKDFAYRRLNGTINSDHRYPTEPAIQFAIELYIELLFPSYADIFHIHNKRQFDKSNGRTYVRYKNYGYPDLWFDLETDHYKGIYFEIKSNNRKIGGKPKQHQIDAHNKLENEGNVVYVINGFNEFLILFGGYINEQLTDIDDLFMKDSIIAEKHNQDVSKEYNDVCNKLQTIWQSDNNKVIKQGTLEFNNLAI